MKRNLSILLIAALSLGALAGCSGSKETAPSPETVADTDTVSDEGLVIHIGEASAKFIDLAWDLGYFEEEFAKDNITYEVSTYSAGPEIVEALTIGEIDFANFGDAPTVSGIVNGAPIHVVGSYAENSKNQWVVANADAEIKTLEDLKGKSVAVQAGTTFHQDLLLIMEAFGWTEADIDINYISSTADIKTAILTGTVDAGLLQENNAFSTVDGGGVFVSDVSDYRKVDAVIVTADAFAEAHPDILKRLLQVIDRTNKWINANPEEAAKELADRYDLDYDYTLLQLQNADVHVTLTDEDIESIDETIQFLYDQDSITERINIGDVIDLAYLQDAGLQ